MADRSQVNGWNNINLNKPEEYSSEFVIGGKRYANVTNVTTGQRQLYFVQPVSNARGLLTTTNTDGTITKGGNYDNFNKFNPGELAAAEAANKQASVALLSNKDISTPTEAAAIKNSKEFKSTTAGSNVAPAAPADPAALNAALKSSGNTRNQFPTLKYPETLDAGVQDVITFSMLKYSPKPFDLTKINISGFDERAKIKDRTSIGRVTLPIPNGIIDSNAVTWGGDSMSAGEAFAANVALTTIKKGFSAGAGEIADAGGAAGTNDVKTGFANAFAAAAMGGEGAKLLSRTEGAILNPNLELLFEAPTLRPFTFTFKLASRSETESKIIRSIIRFFKQGSAAQKSESNLFLKAPHTFQIQYLHRNEEHKFLNKFKECALQSFNVNYTPEGQYATFNDGAMVSYQITMQFQELEPVFNDDYGNKENGPDTEIGF